MLTAHYVQKEPQLKGWLSATAHTAMAQTQDLAGLPEGNILQLAADVGLAQGGDLENGRTRCGKGRAWKGAPGRRGCLT